ncbi:MAG: hypothetical protein RL341_2557 [Pseudomonadota bacterium]|jgi:hypothetical protein
MTSQPQTNAAVVALEKLLAPMVRLALSSGLKYQEVDEVLRRAFVREAEQAMRHSGGARALRSGKLNTSQMSVMTGLQRKEIQRLQALDAISEAQLNQVATATTKRSLASQVLLRWVEEADAHPERVVLPLLPATPDSPSFATLTASVVTDVHHRAVLDELIRLGLVREADGVAELLHDAFVPRNAPVDQLAVLGDNTAAHLASAVENLAEGGRRCLEQSIWGEGISEVECKRLDSVARRLWMQSHHTLFKEITDAPEAPAGQTRHRVRIGMYVHVEPLVSQGENA